MKELGVRPYHTFSCRGSHFVCDVNSARFLRVDEPTKLFVEELSRDVDLDRTMASLSAQLGAERCASIGSEVKELWRQGILSKKVWGADRGDYEQQVARLLRMGTGNIELYLAEACNLRCKYCYVSDNDALRNGLMPLDVAMGAVDLVFRRARGKKDMQITFFGGEPLMNKPVMRAVIQKSQKLARTYAARRRSRSSSGRRER